MNERREKSDVGLAILGDRAPLFSLPLHVGRPNVADPSAFHERMKGVFERRVLSNGGPLVQEFEERLADLMGVEHVIATCNATAALEVTARAMDLSGEVIVPSFTFIATAHSLQWQNIRPVFCDVRAGTHHIDPDRIESLITPQTSGILGVHTWGEPCDVDALADIAHRRRLQLFFDAAHALGCTTRGRPIASFGRATVFSFHATKFINCFEGGAVATHDAALAEKVRLMINFGFAGYDRVVSCGTNAKMHEASAAMGLTNLDAIDQFIAVNRRNLLRYQRGLEGIQGLRIFPYTEPEGRNCQYVVIEVDAESSLLDRDRLQEVLWAENVLARRYFSPGCHQSEPYRTLDPGADLRLSRTNELCKKVLLLPTGTSIDPLTIDKVCLIIRTALDSAENLRQRIGAPRPEFAMI